MSQEVQIGLEFTPNPNTLKYVVEKLLVDRGAANFVNAESAEKSILAKNLFQISGIQAVMIGRNFVTVTKAEDVEWDQVHSKSEETIKTFLLSGESAVNADFFAVVSSANAGSVESKILEILENEIRPAVAMDGGDITFDKFENGVVYLYMQGSCAGCPSSTMTLKMGIETRLKEVLPEVLEVVAI